VPGKRSSNTPDVWRNQPPRPDLPLTEREATEISVDGDTDLARHWLNNTAHVSD